LIDDRLEDSLVIVVGDAIAQRNVARIVFPFIYSDVLRSKLRLISETARISATYSQLASTRKKLPIFVKADRHYSVCCVERLFYAIAMVNVYVNIQNSRMIPNAVLQHQRFLRARHQTLTVEVPRSQEQYLGESVSTTAS
jgi:hypothetical protein